MADLYGFPGEIAAGKEADDNRLKDYKEITKKRGRMDIPFLLISLVILIIGLIMVLSASFARSYYETGNAAAVFIRQFGFSIAGTVIMLFTSRIKVTTMRKYAFWSLAASIFLLIAVKFIGEGEAKRWIDLGFTTFQPSEIAKLSLILTFASMICIYKDKMKTFKYGVLPFVAIIGIICGLLVLEPHFSACVIVVLLGAIMMFAGGTRIKWFAIVGIISAVAAYIILDNFAYASARLAAWKDPLGQKLDGGWQIVQSLYAIGSGGLLGLGLGQGRQKYMYLPEEHNDYIFAIVCEELGFIGAVLILCLFALLIIRGYWLAMHSRDRFGSLVITGIVSLLAIQVFLNVAVVTNFIPSTGISLPLFSYGGTALLMQMLEIGIVLAISRDTRVR